MCKPTAAKVNQDVLDAALTKTKAAKPRSRLLLLTTTSFNSETSDSSASDLDTTAGKPFIDNNHSEYWQIAAPPQSSAFFTIGFMVVALFAIEHALRVVFKDAHELLENGVNHKILARHIGVDFTCCFAVAYLGLKNRHLCAEMWQWIVPRAKTSQTSATNKKTDEAVPVFMCPTRSHARLLTYHPEAQQILVIFVAYQIKNLYDCIVWNDGPEFVFHHIAAGLAAYSGMYPGHSHFYAVFYMGISEISTMVLTLVANFDDQHGVPGLGEQFPQVKVALAACFVVAFVLCRTIIWPVATYHYLLDTSAVLKSSKENGRSVELQGTLKVTLCCLIGLSVLQVAFLYQIVVQGKVELEQMGYL